MSTKFKQTEIGEIPEEWDVMKVGDFADVVGGGTPSTNDEANFNGDIPWITPRDLSAWVNKYISRGERSITAKGLNGSGARLLPRDTVLLTSRAPVGYVAIAGNPVATNQGFKSLVPKNNSDPDFLYYMLKNNTERLINNSSGSTFQELSGGVLKQMVFALPKKQEQQHIASILSSLDDKIELNRKMNNTLEDMAKALFKHWFVDFEFPDEDGKPYKASGREMIESELGMIPKGWEIDTLDKIVTFNPSEGLKKGQMAKYLDMKGLSESGMWCYTDWKREYSGGSKFRNGDTLMARITPCLENGKSGFVNFLADDEIAYGSTEYVVLRSTSLDYCEYVYLLVRSENFRDIAIKSMVGSSGRQRVQMSALIEHKVVFPSTEIIAKLHRYLLPMFHKVRDNSLEIISLTLIRDSLLPKLMSGKIRVN